MPIHIRTGGVWKESEPSPKVGGAWKDYKHVHVRVGGTWYKASSALVVSPATSNIANARLLATCYTHISYRNDGTEWASNNAGGLIVTRGSWLDKGSSSEVWVQRVTSDSLDTDAGSGRLQLSTTRTYGIQRGVAGTKQITITFNFYDAASAGNLIGSSGLLTLSAEYDDGS